jgi:catechol 2,3-dioxygenase-like lactoylglutathione lyase family enzyme
VRNLYARSIFFVKGAERSLRFYTDAHGFTLDWKHEEHEVAFVVQVSLFGLQLILNQEEDWTADRAGPRPCIYRSRSGPSRTLPSAFKS